MKNKTTLFPAYQRQDTLAMQLIAASQGDSENKAAKRNGASLTVRSKLDDVADVVKMKQRIKLNSIESEGMSLLSSTPAASISDSFHPITQDLLAIVTPHAAEYLMEGVVASQNATVHPVLCGNGSVKIRINPPAEFTEDRPYLQFQDIIYVEIAETPPGNRLKCSVYWHRDMGMLCECTDALN